MVTQTSDVSLWTKWLFFFLSVKGWRPLRSEANICFYLCSVWISEATHPGRWREPWGWWTEQLALTAAPPTAGSGYGRCHSGWSSTGSPPRSGAPGGPPGSSQPHTAAGPILRGHAGCRWNATSLSQPWGSHFECSIVWWYDPHLFPPPA